MKLLGSLTSPYARKARVVLAEKKIDFEWIVDSPNSPDSQVPRYNPLARIPVLVLDDDTALFDSPVIVEYLDNLAPNNKLFPQPNRERAEIKRWEALADGILDAAVGCRMEQMRPAGERSESWMRRERGVIAAALEVMSRELGDQPWCMGTPFTFADIAVGCALGYLNFRFPDIDWRGAHPNLGKLHEKLMLRTSFAETVPKETSF
ncbi:MAG: glutathione S-transferase [Gammaproteobacteria bacterium]|nr:glutathione S-transferase [Gammaproteobacteria bacterium]MBU1414594.1 glutathione S-transferase [Gammaproteobacteria bacterium]